MIWKCWQRQTFAFNMERLNHLSVAEIEKRNSSFLEAKHSKRKNHHIRRRRLCASVLIFVTFPQPFVIEGRRVAFCSAIKTLPRLILPEKRVISDYIYQANSNIIHNRCMTPKFVVVYVRKIKNEVRTTWNTPWALARSNVESFE